MSVLEISKNFQIIFFFILEIWVLKSGQKHLKNRKTFFKIKTPNQYLRNFCSLFKTLVIENF